MNITLDPSLEAALEAAAKRSGTTAAELAVQTLREKFPPVPAMPEPRDEWERRLLGAAKDYGVSLPNEAFLAENLYD